MIGKALSHFEITAKLGEGGMGEVYQATDSRLGRQVAIKVLPEAFVADPDRLARFEREARVLAALSHPNVAGIHEVGQQGDTHFLVMELAEGETLAEIIARGALAPEPASRIALQIAEGLEAAHAEGIVHRDLKPANVKVAPDGQVKILDFGLAKGIDPLAPSGGSVDLTASPTMTAQATGGGVLLGTAAYMSPEQARGEPAARHADVWAFGVVLHEMLSGTSPFMARTLSDTVAAVLTREVDSGELPATIPPHLRWLIGRCLERDATLRLRDVGEARICLTTGAHPPAAVSEPVPEGRRRTGTFAAALAAVAAAGLAIGLWLAPSPPEPELRKVDILLPSQPPMFFFQSPPLLSPDGSAILMGSERGLLVRRLDRTENRLIPGSGQAEYSTWSPDSQWIAFVTKGQLWKVPLGGQSPVSIADLPAELSGGGGMVWTRDDRILLAGSPKAGLVQVPAGGGKVTTAVPLDSETERDFHEVSLLPEGRGYLVSVHPHNGIPNRVDAIRDGKRTTVLEVDEDWVEQPVYSPPGYLIYSKGSASNPQLWAVRFSLEELETIGDPFLVAPSGAAPSVSSQGTLCYRRGRRVVMRQPLRLTSSGRIEAELARPIPGGRYPSLSPDGSRLVSSMIDAETYDIMSFDIATRTAHRLTSGAGVDSNATFSPDGRRIAYSILDRDRVAVVPADGSSAATTLTEGAIPQWLPDGQALVYQRLGASWDLWLYRFDDGSAEPLLETGDNEQWPVVSPDGRWLAYSSDETGREEVFVRGFPTGSKVQVSTDGGSEPHWSSPDEILFRSDDQLRTAQRLPGEHPAFTEPRLLLSLSDAGLVTGEGAYSTTPDGDLIVFREIYGEEASVLTLVSAWYLEFEGGD